MTPFALLPNRPLRILRMRVSKLWPLPGRLGPLVMPPPPSPRLSSRYSSYIGACVAVAHGLAFVLPPSGRTISRLCSGVDVDVRALTRVRNVPRHCCNGGCEG